MHVPQRHLWHVFARNGFKESFYHSSPTLAKLFAQLLSLTMYASWDSFYIFYMQSVTFLLCFNQHLICLFLIMDWHTAYKLISSQLIETEKYFQIPQTAIRKLLSTLPPPESSAFRVDFRSSHVHYLNNLEEDPMYKRWRSNLNEACYFFWKIS